MPPRSRKRPLSRGASSSRPVRSKNAQPTASATPLISSPSQSSSSSPSHSNESSPSPPPQPFPWPFQQIEAHDRFRALSARDILPTRYLDDGILRDLGLYNEVMELGSYVGWGEFLQRRHPTYREVPLEFLSTFKVDYNPPVDSDVLSVSFYCMGVFYSFSLAQFSDLMGLPAEGDTHIGPGFIAERVWVEFTGKAGYNPSQSKSSQLRNPALRILHRFMAHSLFGRHESVGVVSRNELFFLHFMVWHRRLYTAVWFIKHISHVSTHHAGKICIGGLITSIAHSLGFRFEEGRDTLVAGNDRVDRATLQHMRLCRVMSGGQVWLLDIDGHPVRPVRRDAPAAPHVAPAEAVDANVVPDVPAAGQGGDAPLPDEFFDASSDVPRPAADMAGPSVSVAPSLFSSSAGWTLDSMMTTLMGRMDTLTDRVDRFHRAFDSHVARTEAELRDMRSEIARMAAKASDEEED